MCESGKAASVGVLRVDVGGAGDVEVLDEFTEITFTRGQRSHERHSKSSYSHQGDT